MLSTILFTNGSTAARIVRSQRQYKDVQLGAIRDRGYLVCVCHLANNEWVPFKVIRKLK